MALSGISSKGSVPQYQTSRFPVPSSNIAKTNNPTPSSAQNSTEVTLSNSARALTTVEGADNGSYAANSGQTASSDITQEEGLLGSLTEKSLAALGVLSPEQEAGTKISFDSVSYKFSSSSSTASFKQTTRQGQVTGLQTNVQATNTQEADLVGAGTIQTVDGRSIQFQIELQLSNNEGFDTSNTEPMQNGGNGSDNSSSVLNQQPADFATQLFNSLNPSGSPILTPSNGTSSHQAGITNQTSSAGTYTALTFVPIAGQKSQFASSSGLINWNAILNQSQTMIDMLDSMAGTAQAANAIFSQ